MRRMKLAAWMLMAVLLLGNCFETTSMAGLGTSVADIFTNETELNNTEFFFMGNIECKDGKVVISNEDSDADTKFICKGVSSIYEEVDDMVIMDSTLQLTALPQGEQFIFAFGLSSIEAQSKEAGNVEIVITNQNGLKMQILAYETDNQATTVMQTRNLGVALKQDFRLGAKITNKGILQVTVNGSKICENKLPVDGVGRFGVLQTGSCGAVFSKLTVNNQVYDRPENTDIYEDFEDGEFNANELYAELRTVSIVPASQTIVDYNGNKVFQFKNTALAYIGTLHQYSNFEISFDIPYFPGKDIYDEDNNRVQLDGDSICIGFGEVTTKPLQATYQEDIDLIRLNKTSASSVNRNAYNVTYEVEGMPTVTDDVGYSVRLTLIDGHSELQVKPLSAKNYTTVATADYDNMRSGYINLWTTAGGTIAIDNLKIVNKDKNSNTIDMDYRTSKIVIEDYDITQESTELVFRPDADAEEEAKGGEFNAELFVICCGTAALALVVIGLGITHIMKRRRKGGSADEIQ